MAGKNKDLRRQLIPYLLLAFAVISALLILGDLISNFPSL